MKITAEQREVWREHTAASPFNVWLDSQVRGADGKLDLERLHDVARAYGVDKQGRYAHLNPGQQRMSIGNILRATVPVSEYSDSVGVTASLLASSSPRTAVSSPRPAVTPCLEEIGPMVDEARRIAIAYRRLTGRPLGVTGEVGEYEACRLLNLELAPVRSPGFDAVGADGRTYQVKSRCLGPIAKSGQRMGTIKIASDWDAVLLVLLDEEMMPLTIWQAERDAVVAALEAPGSRSRNERGALGVSKFKSIGRQVWPS